MLKLDDAAIAEIAGTGGYWYLATEYSRHKDGPKAAFEMACRVAADLLRRGVIVFSPIAHTHPIATIGLIDPLDLDIWLKADQPMMDSAEGAIVVLSSGWQQSRGVAAEIKFFRESCLPVYGYEPDA